MNIYFIYKNNKFNFNVKKDASVLHLKNLASKLINQDKSSVELFYKNQILSDDNATIFQIPKKETNIPIIISTKKRNNSNKLPLLKIADLNKTESNEVKNNVLSNESELYSDYSLKEINNNNNTKSCLRLKAGFKVQQKNNNNEYISVNKVFEDVYKSKNDEINNLNKILGKKFLEYDDVLYKKYKNSFDKDNSQLLEYEKNVIEFKDKQILFLKKLINFFDTPDANTFNMGKIKLDEFYLELSNYYNKNKNFDYQSNFNYNYGKNQKTANQKLQYISLSAKKFPPIKNLRLQDNNLLNSNKLSEDSDNNQEILKEKVEKKLLNKNQKKLILLKDQNRNLSQNNSKNNNIFNKNLFLNDNIKIDNIKKKNIKKISYEKNSLTTKENNNNGENIIPKTKEINHNKVKCCSHKRTNSSTG